MIPCQRCSSGHPLGVFAAGERVVCKVVLAPRHDGIQPGTRGIVAAYVLAAGGRHQDVHVKLKRRIAVFAPCELSYQAAKSDVTWKKYENISREEFKMRMKERKIAVRMLATEDAANQGRTRP